MRHTAETLRRLGTASQISQWPIFQRSITTIANTQVDPNATELYNFKEKKESLVEPEKEAEENLFDASLWVGGVDAGGSLVIGNQNGHRQITTKEIKKEDVSYPYKINSSDKEKDNENRKELNIT